MRVGVVFKDENKAELEGLLAKVKETMGGDEDGNDLKNKNLPKYGYLRLNKLK